METDESNSLAESSGPSAAGQELPVARVVRSGSLDSGRRLMTRMWIVTGLCLALAIGLVVWNQKPVGPTIQIQFEQGYGLRAGNSLQHRGIEVGRVTAVELTEDGTGVVVLVMLDPRAKSLAREGSQFWIVRPRVSLTRVTGLDTVVGARYIEVQPGPDDGPARADFEGLETPLSLVDADAAEISIRFREGHGLTIGDQVRHRGIVIGEVMAVDLNADLSGVLVHVRLTTSARALARQGTQFWIERPTVSVTEIRGLETLVGGRFIAVQPPPEGTGPQREFDGLDIPPPGEMPDGGLEIVLESRQRGGLGRGVPVLYRGFRVGHISSVSLATDAATVEARAWIEAPYRHLIRDQTKFWMNSGVDVKVGLKGVELSADSLSNILIGGVSLAIPPDAGAAVSSGRRFVCEVEPIDEWLEWAPQLLIGTDGAFAGRSLPVPVRVSLEWTERRFGFRRNRTQPGWAVLLSDGRLLGLARLLSPVEVAIDGRTRLSCEGAAIELSPDVVTQSGELAVVSGLSLPVVTQPRVRPDQLQRLSEPTDVLIAMPGLSVPFAIAASRFAAAGDHWTIDRSIPVTSGHDGAPVVDRESGRVVGFVSIDEAGARVVLVPSSETPARP